MKHPLKITDLPAPPPGKQGWPWTEIAQPPPPPPSGGPWPKITVITPSFNQGRFIEATLRSVLLQNYPSVEYFVIDGGSTDNTLDVLRKYEAFLAGWVSEPDQGQAHAINKGLERSSGDIEGYQNSDDGYLPGAFARVAAKVLEGHDFIYGHHIAWDSEGREIKRETLPAMHPHAYVVYASGSLYPEACFWSRSLRLRVGWFKELRYSLDTEWFYRVTEACERPAHLREFLAWFTDHSGRKSAETDTEGRREGHKYIDHPLAGYLRDRGISRFRQLAAALLYIPWKRMHLGQFPIPPLRWPVLRRLLRR